MLCHLSLPALCLATALSPLFLASPPRRQETWGYRGVRARPSDGFSAEFRFRKMRLSLSTFYTAHEAARTYDVTVWHL